MKRILLVLIIACLAGVIAAVAQEHKDREKNSHSLPRFVSLRADKVYARSGPGVRYPIEWVYTQKSAPVEVISEYEDWRRIRDWQGSESWIKAQMLTPKRYVKVVTLGENNLYAKDNYKSKIVAKIEDEVVGEVKKCPADNSFCLLQFGTYQGWMPRQSLFGIYPDEIVD
ncbi:MAG: hypothetical protein IJ184_06190 [Alphaproteobacteria bacterium]|nr:hypothetical protein [Alphaproteobacteria bacterium]